MKTTKNSTVRTFVCTFVTVLVMLLLCLRASASQFEDATVSAGVTNAPGYSLGAAWGDYNNDQYIDLYLAIGADTSGANALYLNNGNGTFTRVGAEGGPIATDSHDSQACAWIDFNNDGYRDMFVVNGGWALSRNDFYWNNGDGTFRRGNVGNLAQLSLIRGWCASADYDGDGWVEVFVPEGTAFWGPLTNRLYHATATGSFSSTDLAPPEAYVNSGVWGDYDNDGNPDIFVCGYTSSSRLYRNDGGGQFTAMNNGLPTGGTTAHAAWADYDRDGDLDIALCSFSGAAIYRNDRTNGFALAITLSAARAWGAWVDYDNDGHLDFLSACGQDGARKAALYHNNGNGTFSSVVDVFTEVANNWLVSPWADFDNDGFMDVVLTHQYGQHRLYHNLGNTNHWIKFMLIGAASNRDAIGAKVRVQATIGGQSVWQMQEVNGGYAFQNDTRLNFGLGDATVVDKVRIEWPSGNVNEYLPTLADRIVTFTEQVLITPVRPTASLGGSVTLTAQRNGTWQWFHDGVALEGQTRQTLNLSNIQIGDAGRYSVATTSGTTMYTNFVYLFVDTQFTKINEGPLVTDTGNCPAISSSDYDGDGYADLFVTRYQLGSSAVYHNNQDGTFDRVLNLPFGQKSSEIGVWGDLDNDGSVDLLHELFGSSAAATYFNNADGTFTASQRASVPSFGNRSLVDFNNDGFLDVYYSRFAQNRLYRNNGDRTFTLMTASEVGPVANVTTFGGTCWADFNDDGWADLYAPHYQGGQSLMFRNDGTGRFVAVNNLVTRTTAPAIAGAWGDYDNDGRLDLCISAHNGTSVVYRNLGTGEFERPAGTPSLTGPCNFAAWVDYDNDGFLDLFFSGYKSGNKLLRNNGDGTFTGITTGSIVNELPPLGGGSYAGLWFDYDNDGFLDLYVINGDDASSIPTANQLYHNNGNSNAWLRVKLLGTVSNRDSVGAKVRVQANYAGQLRWQRRDIIAGDEDNGNHLTADFGLGNATVVNKLRIEWPSGIVEEFVNVVPRQILTIVEPSLKGSMGEDGKMHLAMTMSTNRPYQLQASTDFVNWTTLTNCTGSGSCEPIEYVDPQAPSTRTSRFYRMK